MIRAITGDAMAEWRFEAPANVAAFTTRSIVRDGACIAYVTHDADDGSWQFHDGTHGETPEEDAMVVALGNMLSRDPTLNELADLPEGWCAWRDGPGAPWQRGRIR